MHWEVSHQLMCDISGLLESLPYLNVSMGGVQGRNRLWVSVMESRSFCVMVQLAQRRTMDEVKALMAPPETEQAALKRVVRQVTLCPFVTHHLHYPCQLFA